MAISNRGAGLQEDARLESRLDSYRRLAEIFHNVLAEQDVALLLERIADELAVLVPYDTLNVYQADEGARILRPVLARDQWEEEILESVCHFGQGITGWAVENKTPVLANHAHLDPRVDVVPGTPLEPESFMSIPLISKTAVLGALNIYREGDDALFDQEEFELAKRFGDAAALALDNAQNRERLERLAHTDSLTGLYNHRYFHDRLRSELTRASRTQDVVSLMMLDIDDFKRLNDIYGHGVGDQVLIGLSDVLREMVRGSDVVCRLGGEEFTIVLPSYDIEAAVGLAARIRQRLGSVFFDPAGRITVSIGIAQGPEHAMNPRELVACSEAGMMTAKARGKDRVVLFEEETVQRPDADSGNRDVRSIAHLKMLQSLAHKLNRLNDVRHIGETIADELRTLIDYHSCRVYVLEGDLLVPVAFRGGLAAYEDEDETPEILSCQMGEGITGMAAKTGRSLLIPNALECEFAVDVPGTDDIEESLIAVPLSYGARASGVVVISKLGVSQFDEADVRLMEVLAGNASVALENARLYDAQRREAESAKALLLFADAMAKAPSLDAITKGSVKAVCDLLGAQQACLWFQSEDSADFECVAHYGYLGDPDAQPLVELPISAQLGAGFLHSASAPFVMEASEVRRQFGVSPGAVNRTLAVAPLVGLNGWIAVRQPSPFGYYFTQEKILLLTSVSYEASLAMQKAISYRAQEESAEIANALLDFSRDLATAEGTEVVLERVVDQTRRVTGAERVLMCLQDPLNRDLRVRALSGYERTELKTFKDAVVPNEVARPLMAMKEPFVLEPHRLRGLTVEGELFDGETSAAVAPLQLDGGLTGLLIVSGRGVRDTEPTQRKIRLLSGIADQVKLALNNATSFGNLELTFLSTVEALANALEAKDEYTSSHTRWITDMSLEVGKVLGFDARALKRVELGALFHDIGKIGIPHSILLKPGALTAEEWEVMRSHPELGEKILAPIERLADVRPIIRHCHERFDGNGYPDGKAGHDIPIEARIIFVCDAFHAMTTDRPYRERMPVDEACRRLNESSGSQFDPQVVNEFIALIDANPALARC